MKGRSLCFKKRDVWKCLEFQRKWIRAGWAVSRPQKGDGDIKKTSSAFLSLPLIASEQVTKPVILNFNHSLIF